MRIELLRARINFGNITAAHSPLLGPFDARFAAIAREKAARATGDAFKLATSFADTAIVGRPDNYNTTSEPGQVTPFTRVVVSRQA